MIYIVIGIVYLGLAACIFHEFIRYEPRPLEMWAVTKLALLAIGWFPMMLWMLFGPIDRL